MKIITPSYATLALIIQLSKEAKMGLIVKDFVTIGLIISTEQMFTQMVPKPIQNLVG